MMSQWEWRDLDNWDWRITSFQNVIFAVIFCCVNKNNEEEENNEWERWNGFCCIKLTTEEMIDWLKCPYKELLKICIESWLSGGSNEYFLHFLIGEVYLAYSSCFSASEAGLAKRAEPAWLCITRWGQSHTKLRFPSSDPSRVEVLLSSVPHRA